MSSGFSHRIEKATFAEDHVIRLIAERGIVKAIAKNGTEYTHPDFVGLLRRNSTEASKFIRFAPDGVMLTKKEEVVHFDVKCSETIEKDAYETYEKYRKSGCRIVLFLCLSGEVYWNFIENVRFLDSHAEVGKHPGRPFPVDEDGWIHPRKVDDWYHGRHMSGTPYKKFDLGSFKRLCEQQQEAS